MNFYFLSDIESHLKIDGEYAGIVSRNALYYTADTKPNLVEFLPLNSRFYQVYGGENSKDLGVFKVENGALFYPRFSQKHNLDFRLVFQEKVSSFGKEITVTVVEDGRVKLYLDGGVVDVKTLPFSPDKVEVKIEGEFLVLSFIKKKIALFIYHLQSGGLVYLDVVDEFSISSVLQVKKRHKTLTKTTVVERWNLSFSASLVECFSEMEKPYEYLNEKLIPLAFFENAILGGDVKAVVSKEFNEKTERLREFLGGVKRAIISPTDSNAVWLIGDCGVTNATLLYKNRLIDNVFLDDF
ncbi:MAG: hypothetical protein J6V66_04185 [Clostridia bacterium]|nr:hypothetical protein [Clostridia bacterium]